MNIETLSPLDKKILERIQRNFPVESHPFIRLSEELGVSEEELMNKIKEYKESKIVRQISPVFETKYMGYKSLLMAVHIEDKNVDDVVSSINSHPGVSHNYLRNHFYNVWFTIAVPSSEDLNQHIVLLLKKTDIKEYKTFKALKTYKISVHIPFDEVGTSPKNKPSVAGDLDHTNLMSDEDKRIVFCLQQDLPIVSQPFLVLSQELNITEENLIERIKHYLQNGLVRRFSAILNHRNAGMAANLLTAWNVSEEKSDKVGEQLASFPFVSHCYLRQRYPDWPHSLFAMIHARENSELSEFVEQMKAKTGISDCLLLYTQKEFKKVRLKYFDDSIEKWRESSEKTINETKKI